MSAPSVCKRTTVVASAAEGVANIVEKPSCRGVTESSAVTHTTIITMLK